MKVELGNAPSDELLAAYFATANQSLVEKYGDIEDQETLRLAQLRVIKWRLAKEIMAEFPDEFRPEVGGVRAKMQCNAVESTNYGGPKPQHKVSLGAIYGKEGENKDFADATPSGQCWMQISDGRPALGYFQPGKKYYVTFTEAPD